MVLDIILNLLVLVLVTFLCTGTTIYINDDIYFLSFCAGVPVPTVIIKGTALTIIFSMIVYSTTGELPVLSRYYDQLFLAD